jgi:hypothetical protein
MILERIVRLLHSLRSVLLAAAEIISPITGANAAA